MSARICDCSQERLSGSERLFSKILALGYYDGPTDGVALCSAAKHAYRFFVVAWDRMQNHRIVALQELRTVDFDRVVDLAHTVDPEIRWPIWIPIWRDQNGLPMADISSEVEAVLKTAGEPFVIFLSDGMHDRLVEAWPVTPQVRRCLEECSSDLVGAWESLVKLLDDPGGNLRKDPDDVRGACLHIISWQKCDQTQVRVHEDSEGRIHGHLDGPERPQ